MLQTATCPRCRLAKAAAPRGSWASDMRQAGAHRMASGIQTADCGRVLPERVSSLLGVPGLQGGRSRHRQ